MLIERYFVPRMRSDPNLLRRLGLPQLELLEALRRHLLQAAESADAVIAIDHVSLLIEMEPPPRLAQRADNI
ncbi:hypothetical protein [Bradyrhizobium genosp. P]|uniref:hypothetical protein n=1 Tax=Bradyrhizobium genosp. P TaxID=83641 RepID=UPI003CF68250